MQTMSDSFTCEEVERNYVCGLLCEDGQVCGQRFATKKSFVLHQVHSKGGTHGIRILSHYITLFNQCVICGAALASRAVAQRHLLRSVERGYCYAGWAKGSCTVRQVVYETPIQCPLCDDVSFDVLEHAQMHLASRLQVDVAFYP